MKDVNMT